MAFIQKDTMQEINFCTGNSTFPAAFTYFFPYIQRIECYEHCFQDLFHARIDRIIEPQNAARKNQKCEGLHEKLIISKYDR